MCSWTRSRGSISLANRLGPLNGLRMLSSKKSKRGKMERQSIDRPWNEYPIGTRAYAFDGGYWIKVELGWKWCTGATFPKPGGDACGKCIELPEQKLKTEIDSEYIKTNRENAMTAKRSRHYCGSCDKAVVAQTGKCPICGNRQNRKKRKGV